MRAARDRLNRTQMEQDYCISSRFIILFKLLAIRIFVSRLYRPHTGLYAPTVIEIRLGIRDFTRVKRLDRKALVHEDSMSGLRHALRRSQTGPGLIPTTIGLRTSMSVSA